MKSRALEANTRTAIECALADMLSDMPWKILRELILNQGIPKIIDMSDKDLVFRFKQEIGDCSEYNEELHGYLIVEAEAQLEIHRMLTEKQG